jgi:hypothetical protein
LSRPLHPEDDSLYRERHVPPLFTLLFSSVFWLFALSLAGLSTRRAGLHVCMYLAAPAGRPVSVLFREPVLGLPDTRIFGGRLLLPEYSGCPIGSTYVRGYVRLDV